MLYPKSSQPLPEHARKVYEGILFTVWQWEQTMFDGSTQIFEKVSRRPSVGIFCVTKEGKIVLTKQEQPGMKPFISLVGGIVDPGEEISVCAHRELLEETGCVTSMLDFWYSVQPVTKVEWPVYMFVARGCEQVAKTNPDSGEKINLLYVDWDEFISIVCTNEFRDKEVALKILQLKQNPEKFAELRMFLMER